MAGIREKAIPMSSKPRKLASIKDPQERRFFIEDAVRTFKRFGEMKREIADIKADKPLFKAAKEMLQQEIAETKKAMR